MQWGSSTRIRSGLILWRWEITRLLFMAMKDWRILSLLIPRPRPISSIIGSRNLITIRRMKRVKKISLPRAVVSTSSPVPRMAAPQRPFRDRTAGQEADAVDPFFSSQLQFLDQQASIQAGHFEHSPG